MNDKQETVDDIAWEVRAQWQGCENCSLGELDGKDLLALVTRLVAAHKREMDALTAKLEEAKHCWKVWSDRADELLTKCNEQYAKLKTVA